jgi:hypothetical protein
MEVEPTTRNDLDPQDSNFPPQRPLEKHARIEADLFCDSCAYNLYSQRVERDERLGILVVRCPECGRFQPAGVASNAQRVWLSRFSSILIALWCLFLLIFIGLVGLALGGLQVGMVEGMTRGDWVSQDSVNMYRQWDAQSQQMVWYSAETQKPIDGPAPTWKRILRPASELWRERFEIAIALFFMHLPPLIFGGLLVTFLWHVPRRLYGLGLLVPLLAAVVVGMIYYVEEAQRGDRPGDMGPLYYVLAGAMAVQMLLMVIGFWAGRPVARFFATLFVPPRPRQAIGFLWTIDGKQLPPVK